MVIYSYKKLKIFRKKLKVLFRGDIVGRKEKENIAKTSRKLQKIPLTSVMIIRKMEMIIMTYIK